MIRQFFKNVLVVLKNQRIHSIVTKEEKVLKTLAAIFLSAICFVMMIINIVAGNSLELIISLGILVVGFSVCAALCGLFNLIVAYKIIFAILVIATFTSYAISGSANGMAILWIILMPMFYMIITDIKLGLIVSIYFQVLFIVMFYTPLRGYFIQFYSEALCVRFPIVFFTDWIVSFVILCQKEINQIHVARNAYFDALCEIGNRRMYNNAISKAQRYSFKEDFSILVFDINELKSCNDTFGHLVGDELIKMTAKAIKESFKCSTDELFRTGGDEFVVVKNLKSEEITQGLKNLKEKCIEYKPKEIENMAISCGIARWGDYPDKKISDLEIIADDLMYEDKERYYVKRKK